MKTPPITVQDFLRFNRAARKIEDDMDEAYWTVREQFGPDVAGVVLVTLLRQKVNDKPGQWPPPDDLIEKVADVLRDKGLFDDTIPEPPADVVAQLARRLSGETE